MSKGCSKCSAKNGDDARFCHHCGTPFEAPPAVTQPRPPFVPPPSLGAPTRPLALWIGLGALVLVLVLATGGGVWWLTHARSAALPTFDSAPPPSVLGASQAAASAAAPNAAPIDTAAARMVPGAPGSAPFGSLREAADNETKLTGPAERDVTKGSAKYPAKDTTKDNAKDTGKERAARDAKARALREQRAQAAAQADAERARRRADAVRTRAAVPVPVPAPTSMPRPLNAVPPSAPARTVQERCANLNPFAKGICESRECARAEHVAEMVCQRIKAADDRRREQ